MILTRHWFRSLVIKKHKQSKEDNYFSNFNVLARLSGEEVRGIL